MIKISGTAQQARKAAKAVAPETAEAAFDRKAKKAAAERVRRAAAKSAAKTAPAETKSEAAPKAEAAPKSSSKAKGSAAKAKVSAEPVDSVKAEIAATEQPKTQADADRHFKGVEAAESPPAAPYVGRVLPDLSKKEEKPNAGVCVKQPQALAEGLAFYGAKAKPGVDFTLKKTGAGLWYWGPYREPDAIAKAYASKPTKEKAKAAKTEAKATAKAKAKDEGEFIKRGEGSKRDEAGISALSRKKGATLEELGAALNWNENSTRWWITNIARKRFNQTVEKRKNTSGETVFFIA